MSIVCKSVSGASFSFHGEHNSYGTGEQGVLDYKHAETYYNNNNRATVSGTTAATEYRGESRGRLRSMSAFQETQKEREENTRREYQRMGRMTGAKRGRDWEEEEEGNGGKRIRVRSEKEEEGMAVRNNRLRQPSMQTMTTYMTPGGGFGPATLGLADTLYTQSTRLKRGRRAAEIGDLLDDDYSSLSQAVSNDSSSSSSSSTSSMPFNPFIYDRPLKRSRYY